MAAVAENRRKQRNPRRSFTIGEQLRGKLGGAEADELVSAMHSLTRRTRKRSRRSSKSKPTS